MRIHRTAMFSYMATDDVGNSLPDYSTETIIKNLFFFANDNRFSERNDVNIPRRKNKRVQQISETHI